MKHSLRVIGFVTAISVIGAILPSASAQTEPREIVAATGYAGPTRKEHRREGQGCGQRVRQSEPLLVEAPPRARSSERAITVVRIGEPSERASDSKGTGVRYSTNVTR